MSKRILVVDDEENIRRMIRLTLEAAGYEVGEAADGSEGLESFGDGAAWDAVLLDQKMPGLDGLETLRRMKERVPWARVLMVTAFASVELAVDAMKLGAADFVRKPMTPEVLRNAVAAALSKAPAATVAAAQARAAAPESYAHAQLPVQTITMNGFTILDEEAQHPRDPDERRFIVAGPGGEEHGVVVEIGAEAVGYVERMTRRRLPPENSFWTVQAKRLLSDFLWNEGRVPPGGRLAVTDVSLDVLPVAERWQKGAEE